MATDPRGALNLLIGALEYHFDAAQSGESSDSPLLGESENRLRDAFFSYDDALFTTYGVELPLDLLDEEDIDDIDDIEDRIDGEEDDEDDFFESIDDYDTIADFDDDDDDEFTGGFEDLNLSNSIDDKDED